MIDCDMLIVTAPWTNTRRPLMAPAALKGVIEQHNFTCRTYDINLDFVKLEDTDPEKFELCKNYFAFGTIVDKNNLPIVQNYVEDIAKFILAKYNPKYLAVSVFSYQCQNFSEMFSECIRKMNPDIKLVLGGQGLSTNGISKDREEIWVERLKKANVIDHYIVGEGEVAIVNLLKEGKGPGIDNKEWEQQRDLDNIAWPNYSDYDLDAYNEKSMVITGSRGCVRKCTFCDITKHWKKFTFRSGESIANEMFDQSEKHKKYDFQFSDSLVNGSMKAYRDFVRTVAERNRTAKNKITWSGQFIVRGIKSMTEDDWKWTKESGAKNLSLGVESGSEAVRDHMKKQFSNQDMDEFMEQAHINNVGLTFMMIVGYPTETHEDFMETLRMFKKYKKYKNIIEGVILGSTLAILPGTPLTEQYGEDMTLNDGENFWTYRHNKSLTFQERIKRRIIAGEELKKMGYILGANDLQIRLLHFLWEIYKKKQKQNIVDLNTSNVSNQKYS